MTQFKTVGFNKDNEDVFKKKEKIPKKESLRSNQYE